MLSVFPQKPFPRKVPGIIGCHLTVSEVEKGKITTR